MVARRLIAVLIVLLLMSTIAAALAPVREAEETTSTTTTTATAPESSAASGTTVEREVEVGGLSEDPAETLELSAGDRLRLTVRSAEPAEVEIPGLGLLAFAAPGAPARFDIILREPGASVVTSDGEAILRIEVDGGGPS